MHDPTELQKRIDSVFLGDTKLSIQDAAAFFETYSPSEINRVFTIFNFLQKLNTTKIQELYSLEGDISQYLKETMSGVKFIQIDEFEVDVSRIENVYNNRFDFEIYHFTDPLPLPKKGHAIFLNRDKEVLYEDDFSDIYQNDNKENYSRHLTLRRTSPKI